MPLAKIMILGEYAEVNLEEVERLMKKTIASVPELKLVERQVSVLFPEDKLKKRENLEVVAIIDGLFRTPGRTSEVRKDLAEKVALVLRKFFPEAALVECLVKTFDPEEGFASNAGVIIRK